MQELSNANEILFPSAFFQVRREWDAKDIKKIIASGKGLKTCTIGEISSVQIESRNLDAEHGRLSVVADGEMDVPLHITESKSGYNIHYLAKAEGVFFLRVKVDGRHIRGSPFMITANKKREIPESAKTFFKRGFLMGGKEKKNDLQP
ncbi:unnamed protein product [Orchesella dallaii]|uniref:Uncharacterized protein n=1 Tax=Orchesella dallaii TaxID=48710 RepID=A0ABP1R7L8_9HEXA